MCEPAEQGEQEPQQALALLQGGLLAKAAEVAKTATELQHLTGTDCGAKRPEADDRARWRYMRWP